MCYSPYGDTSDPSVAAVTEYKASALPGKVDFGSTALQSLHMQKGGSREHKAAPATWNYHAPFRIIADQL